MHYYYKTGEPRHDKAEVNAEIEQNPGPLLEFVSECVGRPITEDVLLTYLNGRKVYTASNQQLVNISLKVLGTNQCKAEDDQRGGAAPSHAAPSASKLNRGHRPAKRRLPGNTMPAVTRSPTPKRPTPVCLGIPHHEASPRVPHLQAMTPHMLTPRATVPAAHVPRAMVPPLAPSSLVPPLAPQSMAMVQPSQEPALISKEEADEQLRLLTRIREKVRETNDKVFELSRRIENRTIVDGYEWLTELLEQYKLE